MMAQQQQQDKKIGFKTITLYKEQTLGIGSYGAVCKAKGDDLLCAAKLNALKCKTLGELQ